MYTIFMPKYEKDPTPYRITKVISTFTQKSSCNCIISSPGYMCTTSNTIDIFLDKLDKDIAKKLYIGFCNGMNGARVLPNQNTIRHEYENLLSSPKYTLNPLKISCLDSKDHRKMMFFIHVNANMPNTLDKYNYSTLLNNSTVLGILIGSSNQSLNTYYGGQNSNPADKGEADILMYTESGNSITSSMSSLQGSIEGIRISRSIDETYYSDADADEKYLRKMLEDFLDKYLV